MLRLLRPLYRLTDTGYYWHATLAQNLRKNLGVHTVASDIAFCRQTKGQLARILASYVDGTLACCDSSFLQLIEEIRERFELKSPEYGDMRYSGV